MEVSHVPSMNSTCVGTSPILLNQGLNSGETHIERSQAGLALLGITPSQALPEKVYPKCTL